MKSAKKGILMVISGPSGGGKGTVVKRIREICPEIGVSVSATTRAPREGEENGKAYYFITRSEFEDLLRRGEILEHTVYCENYYGTPKSEVDRVVAAGDDLILEIEVEGALQIKKLYPDAVTVMLVPPSLDELRRRLVGRGSEDAETIEKRLKRAKEEIKLADEYDYITVNENDGVEKCAEAVLEIINAEKRRTHRMKDFINNFCNADN